MERIEYTGARKGPEFTKEEDSARHYAQMLLAWEDGTPLFFWVKEHIQDFNNIIYDDPSILERLLQVNTREEAVAEIKLKLHSMNKNK